MYVCMYVYIYIYIYIYIYNSPSLVRGQRDLPSATACYTARIRTCDYALANFLNCMSICVVWFIMVIVVLYHACMYVIGYL